MKSKWWTYLSKWIIEDTLLELRFNKITWQDYKIRLSFYKYTDNYFIEKEIEKENILTYRKASLLINK